MKWGELIFFTPLTAIIEFLTAIHRFIALVTKIHPKTSTRVFVNSVNFVFFPVKIVRQFLNIFKLMYCLDKLVILYFCSWYHHIEIGLCVKHQKLIVKQFNSNQGKQNNHNKTKKLCNVKMNIKDAFCSDRI